jgi:hypothetical protein
VDVTRPEWRKSSYSSANGGQCVEVARNLPGVVAVRDSQDPDGPKLMFSRAVWLAFAVAVRDREFDLG